MHCVRIYIYIYRYVCVNMHMSCFGGPRSKEPGSDFRTPRWQGESLMQAEHLIWTFSTAVTQLGRVFNLPFGVLHWHGHLCSPTTFEGSLPNFTAASVQASKEYVRRTCHALFPETVCFVIWLPSVIGGCQQHFDPSIHE